MEHEAFLDKFPNKLRKYDTAIDSVMDTRNKHLGTERGPARLNRFNPDLSPFERILMIKQLGEIREAIDEKTLPILNLHRQQTKQEIQNDLSGMNDAMDFTEINSHPKIIEFLTGVNETLGLAITSFLHSERGQWLLTKVKNSDQENTTPPQNFDTNLAGLLFEEIGHSYFEYKYAHPGIFLLSPEELYRTYTILFPEKPVVLNGGLVFGIQGISFPDGFVLREEEQAIILDSVIEYKAIREVQEEGLTKLIIQSENFTRDNIAHDFNLDGGGKENAIRAGRIIHQVRSDIPAKPLIINPFLELIYAVPDNSNLSIPNTKPENVPMSTTQLNQLILTLKQVAKEH